jgi:hypothetical protein
VASGEYFIVEQVRHDARIVQRAPVHAIAIEIETAIKRQQVRDHRADSPTTSYALLALACH